MLLQVARLSNPEAQVYRFNSGGAIGGSLMEKLRVPGKVHVYIPSRFHQVGRLICLNVCTR